MQVEAIPLEVLSILDTIDYIFINARWNHRTGWQPELTWAVAPPLLEARIWTKWIDDNENNTQSIRIYLYAQSIVVYEFLDGAIDISRLYEFLLEDPKCFDKLREYAKNKDN